MSVTSKREFQSVLTLYRCSGCVPCDQATTFMRGWIIGRPDVHVEVVSIMERPTDIVRLGISETPALVLNQELLAQNLTEDKLDELLQEYVSKVDGDWSLQLNSEESTFSQP